MHPRVRHAAPETAHRAAALQPATDAVINGRRVRVLLARGVLWLLGHQAHPPVGDEPSYDEVARRYVDPGAGEWIDPALVSSKAGFLQWLRRSRPVVFHGSMRDDIDVLRPIRLSRDAGAFGDQQAVYASDDPVWAMYFALLRKQVIRWTKNSCSRVVGDGRDRLPRYSFSVNPDAPVDGRLGPGTIYVLPREPFEAQAAEFGVIDPCHLVAKGEVPVLAKLAVTPDDFPFADAIFTTPQGVGMFRVAAAHWRSRLTRRSPGRT